MRNWTLFLMLFSLLTVSAQDFGMQWMSALQADSTQLMWFRHTYRLHERPTQATISIATTGYFRLYINGYDVSTAYRLPYREGGKAGSIGHIFDVTRFLQAQDNIVTVCCSPLNYGTARAQLALLFYGKWADGQRFCYDGSEGWLCHPTAFSLLPDGRQVQDGTSQEYTYSTTDESLACWYPANRIPAPSNQPTLWQQSFYQEEAIAEEIRPLYFNAEGDSVYYEFGTGFQGYVRITLRDATPGERIYVDGSQYICSGQMDEQIFRRLHATDCRLVCISGDASFRRSQIQKVEGIAIKSRWHKYWND